MLLSETSKTCKNMYNVCVYIYIIPDGSGVKNQPANAGDLGLIPGLGDPLEKEMATHSSTLAWEIPWTEEPGRLQPMGSQSQTGLSVLNWKFLLTPDVLSRATSRGVCSMHGAGAISKIGAGRGSLHSSSLANCSQNLHFL